MERQIRAKFKLDVAQQGKDIEPLVTFEEKEDEAGEDSGTDSSQLTEHLVEFIASMLTLDPRKRPTLPQMAVHPFLVSSNPFQLHLQPALQLPRSTKISGSKARDGEWGRRQFSHIWYFYFSILLHTCMLHFLIYYDSISPSAGCRLDPYSSRAPMPQEFSFYQDLTAREIEVDLSGDERSNKVLKLVHKLSAYHSDQFPCCEHATERLAFFR